MCRTGDDLGRRFQLQKCEFVYMLTVFAALRISSFFLLKRLLKVFLFRLLFRVPIASFWMDKSVSVRRAVLVKSASEFYAQHCHNLWRIEASTSSMKLAYNVLVRQ